MGESGDSLCDTVRVFVVDDSIEIRDRLVDMLGALPEVDIVGVASDVTSAVDGFLHLRPDVTILDIRLPGGSGLEVLERIKRADADAVVIILTNYPFQQYRERCLELGAEYFFDKSTQFDQVPQIVLRSRPSRNV